jgi:hypothetical protein
MMRVYLGSIENMARLKQTASELVGRILLLVGIILILALFSWEAFGEELSIIEVRRNIPLADSDPVYKDYYINSGVESGLKKNMVLTAQRKLTVKDATGANTFGEVIIPVGQLKIISVQGHIAIAREYKLIPREDEPMLEQIGVMIGDKVALEGSFIDNKKASANKIE